MRSLLILPLVLRAWALPYPGTEASNTAGNDAAFTDFPDIDLTTMRAAAKDLGIKEGDFGLEFKFEVYEFTFHEPSSSATPGELIILRPTRVPYVPDQTVHLAIRLGGIYEDRGLRYVSHDYLNPIIGGQRVASRNQYARISTTKDANSTETITANVDPAVARRSKFAVFYTKFRGYQPVNGETKLTIKSGGLLSGQIALWGVERLENGGSGPAEATYDVKIEGNWKRSGAVSL